jgi:uncharacterized lipoprotein YbaY
MNRSRRVQPLGLGLTIALLGHLIIPEAEGMAQSNLTTPTWHNCYSREVFTPEKQAWCDRWLPLQNATLIVPTSLDPDAEFTTVTLENGRYEREDGAFFVELVNEPMWMAFGDIDGDGLDDAAITFGVALDPNGQDLATFLTAVMDVTGEAEALAPVRLGDRILLNGPLAIANNRIMVPFLTQTEAFDRFFVVDGGVVSELVSLPEPSPDVSLPPLPDGTIVFSQTPTYALRIFVESQGIRLNLYNKETAQLELNAVTMALDLDQSVNGIVYRYDGDPSVQVTVDQMGNQAIAINGTLLQGYAQVTGTVTYLPRVALPPNAIIAVSLLDVSRMDVAAVTLASQATITGGQQVPIPFTLLYDPEQIDPRFTYAVQARITVDGQLRFITTSQFPVITQGNPTEIEVIVSPQ